MINVPKLILASGSPRRSEILNSVGWEFEKHVADIDETEKNGEKPADYVQRLAREKAEEVAKHYDNALVLGADTTVVIDGQILAKPSDTDDARRMIKMLAGRWHEVLTGVSIVRSSEFRVQSSNENNLKSVVGLQTTKVKFAEMNDDEIEFLVREGKPLDKAGAYAVQAQASLFIEKIEGDFWNVVGLPINLVYRLMREFDG